jgi:hypothetical protein
MKTNRRLRLIVTLFLTMGWVVTQAQQQLEVPGDNFSLEGALELFKKSSSPEEFEKLLNDPDAKVNNLDLNGDGYIDYIRVFDRNEGNIHTFAMQAVISDKESQDVAVISLEKLSNGKAILQITGDEDVYGVETIIEPTSEVRTNAGATTSRAVVNVWPWPIVQFVYGPFYNPWISPWGWAYRPYWWNPWRPMAYYGYYSYWQPYHHYYSVCYAPRIIYASRIYRPYRTTSIVVYNRHHRSVEHYRSAYVKRGGRDRYNDRDRNIDRGRIERSSDRYDKNGRLTATTSRQIDRNGGAWTRQTERVDSRDMSTRREGLSSSNATRPTRENQSSGVPQVRSSTPTRTESTNRWTGSENRTIVTPDRQRTPVRTERSESTNRQVDRNPVTTPNSNRAVERSSGTSNLQRSTMPNSQRSTGTPNVQRSTVPNVQRSTGTPNVQRSTMPDTQRPGRSTNIQRSSSSPSVQRSESSHQRSGGSSIQRSTGSSVQRSASPSRSSGASPNRGVQRSGSSSKSSGSRSKD